MALFETDYSAWDGIYYKVSEENNESFLHYGFLYRNNRGFVWKDFLL